MGVGLYIGMGPSVVERGIKEHTNDKIETRFECQNNWKSALEPRPGTNKTWQTHRCVLYIGLVDTDPNQEGLKPRLCKSIYTYTHFVIYGLLIGAVLYSDR